MFVYREDGLKRFVCEIRERVQELKRQGVDTSMFEGE